MGATEESLSPSYLAEQRITLSLAEEHSGADIKSSDAVVVNIDVSGCAPEGLVAPFELIVSGPSPQSYQRRVVDSLSLGLVVRFAEGGPHTITFREAAHNRWFGCLHLNVKGPLLTKPRPV